MICEKLIFKSNFFSTYIRAYMYVRVFYFILITLRVHVKTENLCFIIAVNISIFKPISIDPFYSVCYS